MIHQINAGDCLKKSGDAIRRIAVILLAAVSGLLIILTVYNSIHQSTFVAYTARSHRPEIPSLEALGETALFNSGSQEELMEMPGIGETLAGRIIESRDANGGFYLPEDLMIVKGIGEKRFADIMNWLSTQETTPTDLQNIP